MRKPADQSTTTSSSKKPRSTGPSSSRASSLEPDGSSAQDVLSGLDAKNPALVVPRNDLVRRKSSLPRKQPRTGSNGKAVEEIEEDPSEEEEDDDEEDEGENEEEVGRKLSIPPGSSREEEEGSTEEGDQEMGGKPMKIVTPAARSNAVRRRDSGLVGAGRGKGEEGSEVGPTTTRRQSRRVSIVN